MTADPLAWLVTLEGVPSAYAAARDGIDVVLRDRGLRRTSPETTGESLLRGAHASAVLEGSASSLEQVRAGEGDEIARDAVRLSASMLALAPLLKTAPLQAIARLHAVVGAAALAPDELGRPRDAASADRLRGVTAVVGESVVLSGSGPTVVGTCASQDAAREARGALLEAGFEVVHVATGPVAGAHVVEYV